MKNVYLTIDDGPSSMTSTLVDYLSQNKIVAIMFFLGKNILPFREHALKAARAGMLLANHGFTHTAFSAMSLQDCESEILKTEELINQVYVDAGVKQQKKLFRFPYGDKGGDKHDAIQAILATLRYEQFCPPEITYPWFRKAPYDTDKDVFWTFDYRDYRLGGAGADLTLADIYTHIRTKQPELGGSMVLEGSDEVALMHDHPWTEEKYPNYYQSYLAETMKQGVIFKSPF